ncbi:sterol desaturase family protein [Paraliomyxa miuraensis]|uniref:sterol desaturase family protein n=1 Tax=Paraliomyxa miuraensis TaxID=376150 RepID=UPI00224F2D74|nr:sterol desaturase family protein [Paraliomyxa miuraensis]MCX4239384.1 sterol desaturase family protein [Paraliomyxa miuraensis]
MMSTSRPRSRLDSVERLPQAAALFFRHGSPRLLAAYLLVLLALRSWHGDLALGDLGAVLGVVIYWPFQEWVLHIHVLHMRPLRWRGRTIDPLAARTHRAHHREPWNLDFVFLPRSVIVALIPVNTLVWWAITERLGVALTGMAAMAAAALLYEWIHYLTHTPYRPRSRYYRSIWRGHRLHHFKNERYWHAFTVPWVDTLMGTNPDPGTVESSATCRNLDGRQ